MIGIHLGLTPGNPIFQQSGPSAPAIHLYADSVAGDDANDGLTPETAFETLGATETAALAFGDGVGIGLARGSNWREGLNLGTLTGVYVASYGEAGDLPVADGSLPISDGAWTLDTGTTYWVEWDTEDFFGGYIDVWDAGVQVPRATSLANCQSTNPSFYHDEAASPRRLYVNVGAAPTGIEATFVRFVLQTGNGATVSKVHLRRGANLNGPLKTGSGCNVGPVLIEHGTKHHFVSEASHYHDICAVGYSEYRPAANPDIIPFTFYEDDPSASTFLIERAFVEAIPGAPTSFYCHGITLPWQSGTMKQVALGAGLSFQIESLIQDGSFLYGTLPGLAKGTSNQVIVWYPFNDANNPGRIRIEGPTIFEDFIYGGAKGSTFHRYDVRGAYDVTFRGGAFYFYTNRSWWFGTLWTSGTLTVDHSTMLRPFAARNQGEIEVPTGVTYVGNWNVFRQHDVGSGVLSLRLLHHGTIYNTLSAWQTATGQDANSVFVKEADQVSGGANAFYLAWAQAAGGTDISTIGPKTGDFRINPNARVYDAADTAYIGTFADGTTPITDAGPQSHWDWNAWALAAGPPTARPVVPKTLEEAKTYVLDPEAWDFYP